MEKELHILLLEDNPADTELIEYELREGGFNFKIERVETREAFLKGLKSLSPDLILSDYNLPLYNGAMALADARTRFPDIPFILVTGAIGEDRAIDILTQGAKDYVMKDRLNRLGPAVRRALDEAEEHRNRRKAEEALRESHRTLESKVRKRTAKLMEEIAERKRIEEDLRQAEAHYRGIVDNAQEGIYQATPEGKFILANRALAEMLEYSSPEDIIASVNDIGRQLYIDPEDHARIMHLLGEVQAVKSYETQFRCRNGDPIWVSVNAHAVRDEKERIIHYEGIVEDITAQKNYLERLRKTLEGTIQAIGIMLSKKDPYTEGHQKRVANLASAIAKEMGLSDDQVEGIRIAGILHDVGKISVPSEILSRPSKLKDMEFELIKTHSQFSFEILKEIEFPWPIARISIQHHERMNGSGYPFGLANGNILMEARILAVADVVESMSSHRPYRPAFGIDLALEEISRNRGVLYDADVVDVCVRLFHEKRSDL